MQARERSKADAGAAKHGEFANTRAGRPGASSHLSFPLCGPGRDTSQRAHVPVPPHPLETPLEMAVPGLRPAEGTR